MILDEVKNAHRYCGLSEAADTALTAAKQFSMDTPDGRYEFENGVFCNVSTYLPKMPSEAIFETHKRYADLQLILSGTETFSIGTLSDAETIMPYNETRDIALFKILNTEADTPGFFSADSGWFYLVFPDEAHAPGLSEQPANVKKAVFKIPY